MIEISRSCSIAIGYASMCPNYVRKSQLVCFLLFRIAGQRREEKRFSFTGHNPLHQQRRLPSGRSRCGSCRAQACGEERQAEECCSPRPGHGGANEAGRDRRSRDSISVITHLSTINALCSPWASERVPIQSSFNPSFSASSSGLGEISLLP